VAPSGEDGGGLPPSRPARRRMSSEELEPAPRKAVPVASFDDLDPADPSPRSEQLASVDVAAGASGAASAPAGSPRTAAGDSRPAQGRTAAAGPGADRERRVGLVDLDALEPGSSAAHEAAEMGELDAPAEQATIVSLEDLRARRSRRSGGRTEGYRGSGGSQRSGDREPTRRTDGTRDVRRARRVEGAAAGGTRGRRGGSSRGADAEPAAVTRSPEEQEAEAKEICLRLLTDRARSKHELATKLRQKGVADEIVEKVLERFDEVGLIDDQAFADAWVRSRHRARGLGRRAIAQELRRKGIAKEVADEALTEVDDAAEEHRARELVDRRLRSMTVSGPEDRQRAGRRLLGMLARKGYPPPIAYRVVRTALAEHGAEEDELGPADLD
jgi:regulatory protein